MSTPSSTLSKQRRYQAARLEAGLCPCCGKKPLAVAEGHVFSACAPCLERRRRAHWERRRKKPPVWKRGNRGRRPLSAMTRTETVEDVIG